MSGFAGLVRRSGEAVAQGDIDAMTDALRHRGPDGRGTWREESVGLGHQHLRATPESVRESLPIRDPDTGVALTMDARIDNRRELCENLALGDSSTVTDGELLLAAYDEWGVECFDRLVGAFAVAIYDPRRDRVVCGRDQTGIKPFYYALADGHARADDLFAFGSEPKAMLALPSVPDEVDDASVFAFLADEFDDPERTFFEPIRRLPPGHAMVVEPGGARKWAYWSPDDVEELDLPSDEAYEERFREVFTEAVRCRLRRPNGTRVGAFLSGGLDSTTVACVADSLLESESLRTFSAVRKGYDEADESEYLDAALDAGDFDSRVRDVGGASPLTNVEERLAHHDAPFYPPIFTVDVRFADELRDPDLRVVLGGLGGDEALYYGRSYLTEYLLGGRVGRFAAEFGAFADQWDQSALTLGLETVAGPFAPWTARKLWRRFDGDGTDFEDRYPLLDAAAADEAGFTNWVAGPDPRLPFDHRDEHRRILTDAEHSFFFETLDAQRATLGLEARYPFYDRRVVEFCLALPADQKVRDGVGRDIVRRALADVLPPEVRTRTDKASSVSSWLDGLSREQERLRERLVESPRHVTQFLDEDELRSAYRRFADEPTYEDGWTLVKAYAVEAWFETVHDRA